MLSPGTPCGTIFSPAGHPERMGVFMSKANDTLAVLTSKLNPPVAYGRAVFLMQVCGWPVLKTGVTDMSSSKRQL